MIGQARRELFDDSFKLTYKASFGTIRNIVAYDSVWNFYGGTQAPYLASVNVPAGNNGTATQFERVKALSDEFRITSNEDSPIRWMIGTYYLDTRRFASITSDVGDPNGSLTRVTYNPIYSGPNPTSTFLGERDHNKASAFFGNASYKLPRASSSLQPSATMSINASSSSNPFKRARCRRDALRQHRRIAITGRPTAFCSRRFRCATR